MAVSPNIFPQRKRRPSAGSFISPQLSDHKLVQSLFLVSQEISSLKPLQFHLKRNFLSIVRKSKLLSILFEELLHNPASFYSPSTLLCLEEMYIVLQRMKTLIEDCSNGSKMWLLMQTESLAISFHELTVDLSILLDIFPVKDVYLNEDVEELVILIRKQCSETKAFIDPVDEDLMREVLSMLDNIKRRIVPDHLKLAKIFQNLGLFDSLSCTEEIESLQDEIQNQFDDKLKSDVISLVGLVRYAKWVLYGASAVKCEFRHRKSASETISPEDFRCPISLDLMRDPVVVATGQTYDRESITAWIESGHDTCPKTRQALAHTNLIPNRALKNLIAMWCREQKIPFETAGTNERLNGVTKNKTALEVTKMTVSFLIKKLFLSPSKEVANGVVYELRLLAKTDSDSRACIGHAGAIPLLVRYLGSDIASEHPSLQVNAVTTILNLSILEANKMRIMETDGALNGVIEVLRSGATWEAKSNAAATIYSLSGIHSYRKTLGKKTRVIVGLLDLCKNGPTHSRKDALVAILNLAGDRETAGKLVEEGVVEMVSEVVNGLAEEAVTILEVVVKKGGFLAIAAAYNVIRKLGLVLRNESEKARESAAATLVTICRKGGSEMVAQLAAVPGIERTIWGLARTGSERGRRKGATLLRILRRWAAGLESLDADLVDGYTTTNVSTSRIV